jgi:hypothetical protein
MFRRSQETYTFNKGGGDVLTSLNLGQEIVKPLVGRGKEGQVLRHQEDRVAALG